MFHTIIFLSYTIPAIYLFVRICQLFIPRGSRLLYVLIFAILFSIYPSSMLLFEGDTGRASQILEITSGYLLSFFLYLFLLVLITDLLLLINLVLNIIPRDRIRQRSLRRKVFLTIICLSATVVIAGIINFNTIRTSEYRVSVPPRSSEISRLRIAFVSDFHLGETTPVKFVERFVKEIGIIKPDLMLYGGDIAEGGREDEKMKKFENLLSSITTKYGSYGVLGNHEHYASQDKGTFFSKAGIEILRDTLLVIDNSFTLAGRNDSHIRNRKSVEEIMNSAPDSLPVILLDHRPTEIEQVSRTNADIQISGHTHKGQLFPINLITNKVYLLHYGYRKFGNTHFFVSSGIRLWGPPVRTTGKSEILVIDITF